MHIFLCALQGFEENDIRTSMEEVLPMTDEEEFEYFKTLVDLEEISNIANMTEKSFCRFFKKSTKRTLTEFINEIRVSKACKLLISENYSVGQICNQTGFSSVSYFNRIFKSMTNHTPKEYRSKMTKNHVVEIE